MRVLTSDQERLLERLLRFAGSSGVLEMALLRARAGSDKASLQDVIEQILLVKRELRGEGAHTPA